jgi:hypothetical protein
MKPKRQSKRTPTGKSKRKPVSTVEMDLSDLPNNLASRLVSGKVSGAEIARAIGVSRQTICRHLRSGKSPLQIVMEQRGGSGGGSGGSAPGSGKPNGHEGRTFSELQRDKLAANIERLQLDLDARRGELVPVATVRTLVEYVRMSNLVAVRELLSLASSLRDRCGGSPDEVETLLASELRRVLEKLSRANLAAVERCRLSGVLEFVTESGTGEGERISPAI